MKKDIRKTIFIVTLFSIAMAFLESAVVIYVRKAYYPEGFSFPLSVLEPYIYNTELIRELATMIMLISIAILAGKTLYQKVSFFFLSFAVWDIFYYIFLKSVIGWPSSLLDWDVLFLFPWAWFGPVLSPVLVSLTFIFISFVLLNMDESKQKVPKSIWTIMIAGWLLQLYTMMSDIGNLILKGKVNEAINFIPSYYNWPLFIIGEIIVLYAVSSLLFRNKR